MITLFTTAAQATAASSAISKEWLVWLCVGVTLFLAFGVTLLKKALRYNRKHHIIGWDEGREITIEWKEYSDTRHD